MDNIETLALALGGAWASGINLYATVLIFGVLDFFGIIDLPPGLEMLTSPTIFFGALAMYLIEFIADKIPGVDSLWDIIHTFIRIPAGAVIAASAFAAPESASLMGDIETLAAMIGGGTITAISHTTKAASRALINTSPEPFTNSIASVTEDAGVVGGLSLAIFKPVVFFIGCVIFALLLVWLLPKLFRGIRSFFGGFKNPVGQMRDTRNQTTPVIATLPGSDAP